MARRGDPARGLAAWRRGRWAELLAGISLRLRGWRILDRRLAGLRGAGLGEIDIVARRGGVVAFIEVKARPSLGEAAGAVSAGQRRRLARAAAAYLARHPDLAGCTLRFDALLVAPGRLPRHVIDAWRPDG